LHALVAVVLLWRRCGVPPCTMAITVRGMARLLRGQSVDNDVGRGVLSMLMAAVVQDGDASMQEQPLHRFEPQKRWIKSRQSAALNACVELARDEDSILLRDSKDPAINLRYSRTEMRAFFDGVKRGEFDHLVDSGLN
jgi:hypothetical protein